MLTVLAFFLEVSYRKTSGWITMRTSIYMLFYIIIHIYSHKFNYRSVCAVCVHLVQMPWVLTKQMLAVVQSTHTEQCLWGVCESSDPEWPQNSLGTFHICISPSLFLLSSCLWISIHFQNTYLRCMFAHVVHGYLFMVQFLCFLRLNSQFDVVVVLSHLVGVC